MMDAFDPMDIYELLDAMDWWGPEPEPASRKHRAADDKRPEAGAEAV
ncbi:hypothetical protein [Paenibacillus humicola]|nr:hypothetical protein [Paenibacillus humicola]